MNLFRTDSEGNRHEVTSSDISAIISDYREKYENSKYHTDFFTLTHPDQIHMLHGYILTDSTWYIEMPAFTNKGKPILLCAEGFSDNQLIKILQKTLETSEWETLITWTYYKPNHGKSLRHPISTLRDFLHFMKRNPTPRPKHLIKFPI